MFESILMILNISFTNIVFVQLYVHVGEIFDYTRDGIA